MDSLYLLIPLSVLAMLAVLGLFAWAVQRRQFDDLDREGHRILEQDSDLPEIDIDQSRSAASTEK